jgi:hypothetical protein
MQLSDKQSSIQQQEVMQVLPELSELFEMPPSPKPSPSLQLA